MRKPVSIELANHMMRDLLSPLDKRAYNDHMGTIGPDGEARETGHVVLSIDRESAWATWTATARRTSMTCCSCWPIGGLARGSSDLLAFLAAISGVTAVGFGHWEDWLKQQQAANTTISAYESQGR